MPSRGHVKWFDTNRFFGFITAEVEGKLIDYFLHGRNVVNPPGAKTDGNFEMADGTPVEFEVHERRRPGKADEAINVRLL